MVEMKGICNVLHGLKPVLLMVLVQIAYTAVNVLFKLAINDGMSVKVATAYRLAFGSAFTVPLVLISERSIILITSTFFCFSLLLLSNSSNKYTLFSFFGPDIIAQGNID